MRRDLRAAFIGAATLLTIMANFPGLAAAQVDCEAMPAGPARTDCYIGLSRIYRQKSDIAAGIARQQSDRAIYRQVTGTQPRTKRRRVDPDR
jgi:hypothetical protein